MAAVPNHMSSVTHHLWRGGWCFDPCFDVPAGSTGITALAALEQLEAGVERNAFGSSEYLRTAHSVTRVRALDVATQANLCSRLDAVDSMLCT